MIIMSLIQMIMSLNFGQNASQVQMQETSLSLFVQFWDCMRKVKVKRISICVASMICSDIPDWSFIKEEIDRMFMKISAHSRL